MTGPTTSQGGRIDFGAGDPAVVIDGVVAHHLEVLGLVRGRRVGVGLVERVGEAHALDRLLLDAVDLSGAGMPQTSRIVGTTSIMWWNWLRMPPTSLMWPGHETHMPCRMPPKCEAICLVQLNGVSNAQVQPHRHVIVGLVGAPDVVEVLQLLFDRNLDAVEHGHFVRRADQRAFDAAAVVAADVDDQRVVELAHVLDGLNDAADFVVGVGQVGGIDFDLPDEHLLLVGVSASHSFSSLSGHGVSFASCGITPSFFWLAKICVAELVPAFVEQVHVADFLDPFRRRMVRRVRAAGHVVAEERLAGIDLVDLVQPLDGVVGLRGRQVPAGLADVRIDGRGVAEQVRLPLARVAADEAVEVFEAHADRPLVERADLAGRESRRVVILAEPRRGEAVVLQDAADRRLVLRDDAVVARETGRLFRDHAETHRMMVAAGDQRCARRRAERGGMETACSATPPWRCDPAPASG